MAVIRFRTTSGRLRVRVAPPPPASAAPTPAPYGAARIDLAWAATPGASSYAVQRRPSGPGAWADVGTAAGASFKDAGLTGATAYDYRTVATVGGAPQAPSPAATATTPARGLANPTPQPGFASDYQGDGYVPSEAIQANVAPFSASSIHVAWTVSAGGADYYAVQRSPDGVSGWRTLAVAADDVTLYADDGLAPSTTYYYRVRAGNAYGEVPQVDTNAGADGPQTTYAAGPPALAAAHGLAASALSQSSVQVRWLQVQAPEGVEASNYLVERSADGGSTWTQVASQSGTIFTDSGLSAATTYQYRHKAVGAGGASAPSSPVSATTYPVRSGRSLLRPEDFTYLGSFQPPAYPDPAGSHDFNDTVRSTWSQSGFAMRRVGGQLRFFGLTSTAQADPSFLYEFAPPASLATSPPFPAGARVKYWGDPYNGKKLAFAGAFDGAGSSRLHDVSQEGGEWSSACFMDPAVANRVWITYADWYNVPGSTAPSFLACDVDDGGGSLSTAGPYRFDEHAPGQPTTSKTKGGFGAVPQWFADAHLNAGGGGSSGDAWRMCGFGGNEAGAGVSSFGPSVVAFNASALAGKACLPGDVGLAGDNGITVVGGDPARHTPLVPSRTLAEFHYRVDWCTRPPGTSDPFDVDYSPDATGVGHFYTLDRVKGGLFWIDDDAGTRPKHGVFVAAVFGFGRVNYKGTNTVSGVSNGGPSVDGGQAFAFTVVDPSDLAAVAAGSASAAVPVSPAAFWAADFHDADQRKVPYLGDLGVDTTQAVNGVQFDPATDRLYVCVGRGPAGVGTGEPTPIVHVYQVAT